MSLDIKRVIVDRPDGHARAIAKAFTWRAIGTLDTFLLSWFITGHVGAAGAIGPSLQSVGISQGYYFFNAAPYILTLFIMIASARSKGAAREVPGELSITK